MNKVAVKFLYTEVDISKRSSTKLASYTQLQGIKKAFLKHLTA